jgi:acyl carrier protein
LAKAMAYAEVTIRFAIDLCKSLAEEAVEYAHLLLANSRLPIAIARLDGLQPFNTFTRNSLTPMQEVPRKVTEILVEKLGIAESEITPDANFVKDLGIDSLDYAEIVMEFEQTFDIRIPDDDAEKMQTFGQAVKYIQEKLGKKA